MTRRKPVEFDLDRLDVLLAQRAAEDDRRLTRAGICLDDMPEVAAMWHRQAEIRAEAGEEPRAN